MTALPRARFRVAREAGHDQGCALAFAARLKGQQATTRARLSIDPCRCLPRGQKSVARHRQPVERRPALIACADILGPASFGEALERRIAESGLSLNEVARRVGIHKHSLYRWRDDRRTPAPAYRTALRVALDLDEDADGGWWRADWGE